MLLILKLIRNFALPLNYAAKLRLLKLEINILETSKTNTSFLSYLQS